MATIWTATDIPPQQGKLAVVTGANSGLGLETAAALAAAGAHVVLACRSRDRTDGAIGEIRCRVPQARLEFGALDLADLDSVRAFAGAMAGRRIDLLVNNAGVMALPLCRTRQGFEMQIGTNHLGHFALTGLLHERLAPDARIVTVASLAHRWTRGLSLDDLNFERAPYDKWGAYGKSKLANLLFTFELDRRLRAARSGVLALAAHPGYSASNLGYAGPAMSGSRLMRWAMTVGNAVLAQSAAMGALPTLYAATAPGVRGGEYYGSGGVREMRGYPRRVGSSRAAQDQDAAGRLWVLSERLTGVRFPQAGRGL